MGGTKNCHRGCLQEVVYKSPSWPKSEDTVMVLVSYLSSTINYFKCSIFFIFYNRDNICTLSLAQCVTLWVRNVVQQGYSVESVLLILELSISTLLFLHRIEWELWVWVLDNVDRNDTGHFQIWSLKTFSMIYSMLSPQSADWMSTPKQPWKLLTEDGRASVNLSF